MKLFKQLKTGWRLAMPAGLGQWNPSAVREFYRWTMGLAAVVCLAPGVMAQQVEEADFGDAPEHYPTNMDQGGAFHIKGELWLGERIDFEQDGIPSIGADGDDTNPPGSAPDEDGVVFEGSLEPGQVASVRVIVSGGEGVLQAWVDFNRNGDWEDLGEQIIQDRLVKPGEQTIEFKVPQETQTGRTYARFRLGREQGLSFRGYGGPGEVEDWLVKVGRALEGIDFGDAPEPFPTLMNDKGAAHQIMEGFHLGQLVDADKDGQPDFAAEGDDLNPPNADDEDGVVFVKLVAGQTGEVEVILTGREGRLDAWIDFNGNRDWSDAGERIFTAEPLSSGVNVLTFPVPVESFMDDTYARFRLSREGRLPFHGLAPDGEVEDYRLIIEPPQAEARDFGDAPEPFPTLRNDNGASHLIVEGFHLGQLVDADKDGQPDFAAEGDDLNPPNADDEDGVVFVKLVAGQTGEVEVILTGREGRLDAWIDFNGNRDWSDAGERIFTAEPLSSGVNVLTFPVPVESFMDDTYARFRLSREGRLPFHGPAQDGEVEDYRLIIEPPQVEAMDYGDAPAPYPTLSADNGAAHHILDGFHLGELVDADKDGQPHSAAEGDDLNPPNADDEDGVTFLTPLRARNRAEVGVVLSGGEGRLDAWVDFNRDGDWMDDGEQIFASELLVGGVNRLGFDVPSEAEPGATVARFRLTQQGGTRPVGVASDGEVEDHEVQLEVDDCVPRTNKGRDFWVTFPGNYAPDPDNPLQVTIGVVGLPGTTGKVEMPGIGWSKAFVIPANMKELVVLPMDASLGDSQDEVLPLGVHVTAEEEVAVFGVSRADYTTDGFLGLPVDVLGREYLVQSYANVHTGVPSLNGTQFAVVAVADETEVTIVPSVTTASHSQGVAYQVVLQRGETYQLRNGEDAPADLSGTRIQADKPVAVFGSHRCANVPDENVFFCDYLVEQLIPVERAGREFVTAPLITRSGGDTIRVMGIRPGTVVRVNGVVVAVVGPGEIHQQALTAGALIRTDHPVFVTQYANSSDFDMVRDADPFMAVVPSVAQHLPEFMLYNWEDGFDAHYLNIIAPDSAVGTITLDGGAMHPSEFAPITGSGFSLAQRVVSGGAHQLSGSQPFTVLSYGFAEYESYGYPGGMAFGDVVPPEVTCLSDDLSVTVGADENSRCEAPVPDLRDLVRVRDNCGLPERRVIEQRPPPGTMVGVGEHMIELSTRDLQGNVGSCSVQFTVEYAGELTIICPEDMVVACTSEEGARVSYRAKLLVCDPEAEVVCEPASGSLFPPGQTTVTCVATDSSGATEICSFVVDVRCKTEQDVSIELVGRDEVRIGWSEGQVLETAPGVGGPWTVVEGATSPYTEEIGAAQKFFRVR